MYIQHSDPESQAEPFLFRFLETEKYDERPRPPGTNKIEDEPRPEPTKKTPHGD